MTKRIISAKPDSTIEYCQKIWQYRSLIFTLAKRDLKIKYAQTFLGLAWTLVQPITAVAVYSVFFSMVLNFEANYPFILFVLSGILIWGLFNYIFSQGSTVLNQNQELIKKNYFPKIILHLSKILIGLVEFSITLIVLVFLLIFFQIEPQLKIILAPLVLIPLILFSVGLALIMSAATIKKRDLTHIVPFLVNFGIWLTPVFYPVSLIPDAYKNFIFFNPIASIIQLFRWCLFGDSLHPFILVGLSLSFLTFIIGFFYFKKNEDQIIDII